MLGAFTVGFELVLKSCLSGFCQVSIDTVASLKVPTMIVYDVATTYLSQENFFCITSLT